MPGVAIVTDTTHYMPREVTERHGLHEVSLYVNWNGRTDRESDLADYDAFYEHLRSGGDLPSTSQPSVGDFLAVYEPLVEEGRDILSIHLSGASRARSASPSRRARRWSSAAPKPRIQVVDSRTGCAGHGLMAIAAANAVRDGADLAGAARGRARAARGAPAALRRRHARVPQARRADRRRAGVPRIRAEDQADPHHRG